MRGRRDEAGTVNRCNLSTRFVGKVGLILSKNDKKTYLRGIRSKKSEVARTSFFFCGEKAGAEWYAIRE